MNLYSKARMWSKNKIVRSTTIGTVVVVVLIGIYFFGNQTQEESATAESLPVVKVTTASQFAGNSTISLIGTVRAFSEASITTEATGRVTDVRVQLGQTVAAGQVLAALENSSQQASVLQAEGVYDSALASAAQSNVGTNEAETNLRSAKNNAVATAKSAYGTVEDVILNNIDQYFTSPNTTIPGLRIDGAGFTSQLNNTRVQYQSTLPSWKTRVDALTIDGNLDAELDFANVRVSQTLNFVDTFITVFNSQDSNNRYTDTELQTFSSTFNRLRSTLIQTQTQINTAQSSLDTARESVERATLAASGGTSSAADAQIKQALGSLRAAQANLAKTIIRAPISGTVNSLDIRTGDFVNSFVEVAQVANNEALEIITFIGENDRAVFSVGDNVQLDNQYEGTITQIAPAVNANTGKIEVRIASESSDLQNGDSVSISKEVEGSAVTEDVIIPLSAVKFALGDGSVFVVEDNRLQAKSVTLGTIRGGSVEIVDGLTANDEFVSDARGLVESTQVEVIR